MQCSIDGFAGLGLFCKSIVFGDESLCGSPRVSSDCFLRSHGMDGLNRQAGRASVGQDLVGPVPAAPIGLISSWSSRSTRMATGC